MCLPIGPLGCKRSATVHGLRGAVFVVKRYPHAVGNGFGLSGTGSLFGAPLFVAPQPSRRDDPRQTVRSRSSGDQSIRDRFLSAPAPSHQIWTKLLLIRKYLRPFPRNAN